MVTTAQYNASQTKFQSQTGSITIKPFDILECAGHLFQSQTGSITIHWIESYFLPYIKFQSQTGSITI